MELNEKMKLALSKHEQTLSEYKAIFEEYESSSLLKENAELKSNLQSFEKALNELKEKYSETAKENEHLKISLHEQIVDEKLNILKISKEKIDNYFENAKNESMNTLEEFEASSLSKIEKIKNIAESELDLDKKKFITKAGELLDELNQTISQARNRINTTAASTNEDIIAKFKLMSQEPVSEEVMKKRVKQNDLEIKIGLNWVNKVGIVFILLAVAAGLKYSYDNYFAQYMKGFFAFVIGGLFLAGGEYFIRKGKDVFAKGLTGGGIGILYFAIFNAYFSFKLIGLGGGMLISVLVTLTALVLSLRENSKTICAFSLIGGYLPFITYAYKFDMHSAEIFIAMGYLLILNVLILSISFYKRWIPLNYISFMLNIPTIMYLISVIDNYNLAIIYTLATFFMYLSVTLIYPLKHKQQLNELDVMLLGINTFFSCAIMFSLFKSAGYTDFYGMLAVVFCISYFGIGQLVSKMMPGEKSSQVIFYITSLAFAILTIPLQFGIEWLAVGWLAEAVLLIIYGYKFKFRYYEISGWIIYGLCLGAFFLIDIPSYYREYFDFKYISIVISLICVLTMYLYEFSKNAVEKYTTRGELIRLFKYFVILNVWGYLIYGENKLLDKIDFANNMSYKGFFESILFAILSTALAYVISKLSAIKDKVVDYFVVFLYVIIDLTCFKASVSSYFPHDNEMLRYIALSILIIFNILVFFSVRDLLIKLIDKTNKSLEMYPLIMSIYLLLMMSIIMTAQLGLREEKLIFSLMYLILSFIYIAYGFKKRYYLIRWFGLGLSFFAAGKLFIYDLSYLQSVGRIIAYFCFGLVMLAISFIYQKLKVSLDNIKVPMKSGEV